MVESIPDDDDDDDDEDDDDDPALDGDDDGEGDDDAKETQSKTSGVESSKSSVKSAKSSRTGKSPRRSPRAVEGDDPLPSIGITPLSPPKPKFKRSSPSMGGSGTPPKIFKALSPRVQASIGLSPGGTSDAPSHHRGIGESDHCLLTAASLKLPSPKLEPQQPRTFEELYDKLEPDEKKFFDMLDEELDKVETFYTAREDEAENKYRSLRGQLEELANHRKVFHERYPDGIPEWEAKVSKVLPVGQGNPLFHTAAQKLSLRKPFVQSDGEGGSGNGTPNGARSRSANVSGTSTRSGVRTPAAGPPEQYDPERYQKYKKDLRAATQEFYRHLELIKNYRVGVG